jgi:NAD(P)-dependent dehydrogenase (short-subunit alcohol dehydrogenase family)
MPTVLITGANRGIGLELDRQYAADSWNVIATARQSSPELDALGVRVEPLDLSDPDALAGFAKRISGPLDLFIANAGVSHPMETDGAANARDWQAMMMVNMIAPFQLAQALLPRLAEARGKAICISSGMGSIADSSGGWIPYRTSKAALNMAWSCLALEAKPLGVTAVALSPGWVKTRMGGGGAEITTGESVGDMRKLIDRLTIDDTGKFLRRDGSELPW